MADELISRQAARLAVMRAGCIGNIIPLLDAEPAVDAVEVGSCEGCIYSHRKRPQKCSCCARNKHLKDCYEEEK